MYAIYGNMDPINIPPMLAYIPYMDPMGDHTVLLRSDATAVACGEIHPRDEDGGRFNIPPLEEGMSYTQVSAGDSFTVLLRRDGRAAWLVETTQMDNAIFHPWMREHFTLRFLQVISAHCFSEVMAALLLAERALMSMAPFFSQSLEFATSVSLRPLPKTLSCN